MKKICFLLYTLDPGGLEIKLLRFLSHNRMTIDATIISKSGKTGSLENEFKLLGAKVIFLKGGYFNLKAWVRYYKFFKDGNWDSVCDFTGNFGGIYMLLAKMASISKRISYYGQASNHFKETFLNLFYNSFVNQLVLRCSTTIISNSETALLFFFGKKWKNDSKFHVVNNGIEISTFKGASDNSIRLKLGISATKKIIVQAARYDEKKNHFTALKLARWFKENNKDVFILFCGKDTEKLNIKIKDMGIEDWALSLGYRADINVILKNADAFYLPSYTEGQPNALIEAIISGLPFIASNIEAIKEIIPFEFHNQLVDPDDYLSAALKFNDLFEGKWKPDNEKIRSWAIREFDAGKRFSELSALIV